MFVTQAHSFVQQARLAVTLAWIAGYTNIVTLLACGVATSHISGTTSNLGRDVAEGKWAAAGAAAALIGAFLAGAAVSGLATELGRRRNWESIYILPMLAEAVLLGVFAVGVEVLDPGRNAVWLAAVACSAMGVQNATITRISSGVIRTTHVTGVATDLGLEAVQFFWWLLDARRTGASRGSIVHEVRQHAAARRLFLLLSILVTFALGAGLGALAYDLSPKWSMFPPVLFLMWIVFQDARTPIAEIAPSELVRLTWGLELPGSLAVFHVRKGRGRKGRLHRMPNLLAWVERLPGEIRVVILDLSEVEQIDANAALDLRAAAVRLRERDRGIVLAGLTPAQYRQLQDAGAGGVLDPMSVCADLELAVARGLNVVEELEHAAELAAMGRG
jgi:uncharacterized membrane protein YoaK (UPF0700 family)/anti-anti-sigma regulatory factor